MSDRPTSAPASVSSSTQQQQPCSTAPTNMESKPENITSASSMGTPESQPELSTSELGATVDLAPEDGAELGACGGSIVVPSSGPSVAEFLGPAVAQDLVSIYSKILTFINVSILLVFFLMKGVISVLYIRALQLSSNNAACFHMLCTY